MKVFATIALIFSFCGFSFCQDYHKIDSLRQVLLKTEDDSIKAETIFWISREYMWTKPDTCLFYTNKGMDLLSETSRRKMFEGSDNFVLGHFEIWMYLISSLALSEQRNDSLSIRMGQKSLQLAEKSKNNAALTVVYGELSEIYRNIGEPAVAINYVKKELALDTAFKTRAIWTASLGSYFYDLGEYDSALYYLKYYLRMDPSSKLDETKYWPVPHLYLGKVYTKKGNYAMAIYSYKTAISYAIQSHLTKDLGEAYFAISEAFQRTGQMDSALFYATQSLQIANQLSLPAQSLDASGFLSSVYEAKGIMDSAFKYQKLSSALKDSLFNRERIRQVQNYIFNERLRLQETEDERLEYRSKIRTYALTVGLFVLLLLAGILYRNNRQKQRLNTLLKAQNEKIQNTLIELKSTQTQLIQSEKMASLGELTAGIAHEIENPLNFVNNFAEVNAELISELNREIDKGNLPEVKTLAASLQENEEKIIEHGKRADSIVKSMLQHSRISVGQKEPTDINALCEEWLRLSYQGFRAINKNFNAKAETDFDPTIGKINIVPQDMARMLLNLYNNAFYAVNEKKKNPGEGYGPIVKVSTRKQRDKIEIRVSDNGIGIPKKIWDKIFQPFFTTKPAGQGTGLGLSLAYDIVTKGHNGELKVDSTEGNGSEFTILLPITDK